MPSTASDSNASRPRLGWLDPLRILASFAVTWHHVRGGMFLGVGFGLFLFLLIMVALAASSERAEPFAGYARRKARYLLVPWLRWSAIYALLYALVDPLLFGRPPLARLELAMVFYGTRIELWFLPFAVVLLMAVKALERPLRRLPAPGACCLAALAGVLAASSAEWSLAHGLPRPSDEWLGALAALPLGIALGQTRRIADRTQRRIAIALLVSACAGAYLVSPWAAQGEDLVRRYAVALALAALGFGWSVSPPGAVRLVARRTFGVYLVHPLAAGVLGLARDWSASPASLHVLCVWGLSIGIVFALGLLRLGWVETPPLRAASASGVPAPARSRVAA